MTYNDNAIIRVKVLVKDIVDVVTPFEGDIIPSADRQKLKVALEKAVDFALKSQIVNNGAPTVWCAQHDTANYKPVEGRAYELPSKSGSESAGIVWFLMNWENQTPEVQKAIKGALAWYKKTRVGDLNFSKGEFLPTTGASMWYRFYEVNNDNYFFCDREGVSSKTSCEPTNSLKNSPTQHNAALHGSIQNGFLFLKNAPEGLLAIRVRQLNGEIVLEQQTSSASGVFLGILKNGVYLFEVIQNQQPADSFLLPVYQK